MRTPDPRRPRAALYYRVSTEEQSADMQAAELRRLAEQRGWEVVGEFRDVASGAKDRRPALDRMIAGVRTGQIDVVAAWSLDRLSRSLSHLVKLSEEFASANVGLVIATQPVDTTTPVGNLVYQILGAVAEFERAIIRSRVQAGVRRAIKSGKKWGRPKKVTPEILARAQSLRTEGKKTWRQVAMACGVKVRTLRRALSEAGVESSRSVVAKTSLENLASEARPAKE